MSDVHSWNGAKNGKKVVKNAFIRTLNVSLLLQLKLLTPRNWKLFENYLPKYTFAGPIIILICG